MMDEREPSAEELRMIGDMAHREHLQVVKDGSDQDKERITELRAGVELLASLEHTQHYTHPQASHRGWEHCSLAECVAARKVLAPEGGA